MNFLKLFFFELYRRRRSILMSVAIAFVAWFVAIIITDKQSVMTIDNVPIEVNLTNTQIENLGFDVVKINPATVSVKVKGPRYKIGLLSKDDVSVTAVSFRNVTRDGDYEIALRAEIKQVIPEAEIHSISKSAAVFTVDIVKSKNVKLTCDLPNISAQEGFFMDTPRCQPETLCVQGPKKLVDCLKTIQLEVNVAQKNLNETKTFDAEKKFISIDGKEMDSSIFRYDKSVKCSVDVPIYRLKQVPLTFLFSNAPKKLNLNLLKNCVKISPSHVNLGLSNEYFDKLKELSIGNIDMRCLDFNTSFNFDKLGVPSGCKKLDKTEKVTVSFNDENWSSRKFVVDDIQIVNADDDFDVKIKSPVLGKVKIVGFKNFIENLNVHDITATVDLRDKKLKAGEQTVNVDIGILNSDGVWPVGVYECCISAKKVKK